ncbi:DUF5801 domain-containing protein [Bradyrhizobium quebecense]|uniref:DUF5801 domain-containing protein n=1 Tax=Bradyrhizobium quebecense TaxID=2748629 RepID=A0A973WWU7_9BRAD|nr:DUF5801 repeats-in-toxin domain-containing protein [Bradyrhizobium quebecense]UGA43946.1 DUF5801 domain-containing protein [Bradyrhizobium quebecense]
MVGVVHTAFGCGTIARARGIALQAVAGDPVCQGDVIEIAAGGRVEIRLIDGTVLNLPTGTRLELGDLARNLAHDSASAPGLFAKARSIFRIIGSRLTGSAVLTADTPVGPVRASGLGMLTFAALTFSLLENARAAEPNVTFLDDDTINYKDLHHGVFELVTKEAIPRHIVVDDPGVTIILSPRGSSVGVNQVTNSPAHMEELRDAQQQTLGNYAKGIWAKGSGMPTQDGSSLLQPINFSEPDPPLVPNQLGPLPQTVLPFIVFLTPPPRAPILNLGAAPTEDDTPAFDKFNVASGTFSAISFDGALTFGVSGGVAGNTVLGQRTYNISSVGAFGTLYLNSSSGAYTFVPNNNAINALKVNAIQSFIITVTDGSLSTSESFNITIIGVDDASIISGVTSGSVVGVAGVSGTSPGLFIATGMLTDTDVDDPANTFTAVATPTASAGGYGSFTITTAGAWTYTLDIANSTIQGLKVGDVLTDSFTVTTIGGTPEIITITIHGPLIGAGTAPSLTLSETHLTATALGDNIAGSAPNAALTTISADFSAAFNTANGLSGTTVSYEMTIAGGNGAASGLIDSHTGLADLLVLNGTTIEGRVGAIDGTLAFTIALDPVTGRVTFTEYRAVKQPLGTSPDTGEGAALATGAVTLYAIVTNDAGELQFVTLDLGSRLTITDDGPSIRTNQTIPSLTLSETHLTPTALDDNIAGSAPDAALMTTSADFSAAFSPVQGADGATIRYALAIAGGNGTASGLTDSHTGLADVLVLNGNTIEGHVGTTGGTLAFTITLDPATGRVTFTDYRAVSQPFGTDPDGGEAVSLTAGIVSLIATITDNDGDFQSARLDLGSRLSISDDGPTIKTNGTAPSLTLSESHLTATPLDDNIAGSAPDLTLTTTSADFSTAFTSIQGADGATIRYALTITGGNGTASGLIDSHTGLADVLVLNGNTIEGHVGTTTGTLAFSVVLNPVTGQVTFTEYRAVKQSADGSGEGVTLCAGVVNLVTTITDKDGDFQNASLDLGTQLTITGDSPSINTNGTTPSLTLSETHLTATAFDDNIAGSAPNAGLTTTSADFSTAFSSVQGANGATIGYALTITGGNGTASGLTDSHTGLADMLVLNGNTVEGHVGGTSGALAFTITVNPATGLVTFTEYRAVKQPLGTSPDNGEGIALGTGLVNLVATITDNDGNFQSASLDLGTQLTMTDDGPSIRANGTTPSLSLSETHLTATVFDDNIAGSVPNAAQTTTSTNFSTAFTSVQGADGATIAYALAIASGDGTASGLIDSHTGLADLLVLNGNTIEGHVGATNGTLAFTITIDPATGLVTFTEYRAVKQPFGTSPDGGEGVALAAGIVGLTATITDKDGDFQSASLDLGTQLTITDDGPSIRANGATPSLSLSETHLTATVFDDNIAGSVPNAALTTTSTNFSTAFTSVQGADGATINYALTITGGSGTASGLVDSHTGLTDLLVLNGNTIEGHVGAINGTLAFTITIDPVTGLVTFTEYRAVKQPLGSSPDSGEGVTLGAGLVNLVATITDKDGDFQSTSLDLGTQLTITDDGPSITANGRTPSLTLSETHLTATTLDDNVAGSAPDASQTMTSADFSTAFTSVQGADGASIGYALTISGGDGTLSGLIDSHTGLADVLVLNGDTIEGHVGSTTGTLAFAIEVDPATGLVTFTEFRAVTQPLGSSPDAGEGVALAAGTVHLVATITDKDGDFQSASLDLGKQLTITDDGPTIGGFPDTDISGQDNQIVNGTYNINFGADGDGAMFVGIHNGAVGSTGYDLATSSLGGGITSVHVTGNGDDYTFYYSTHALSGGVELDAYLADSGGLLADPYFKLMINPDGTYSFDLESVDVLKQVTVTGSTFGASGGGTPSLTAPDGELVITGSSSSGQALDVKASNNGIAVGDTGLSMDPAEQLNLAFSQEQPQISFIFTQWQGNGTASVIFKVLDGNADVHDFNIDVPKPSGGTTNVVVQETTDASLLDTFKFDSTTTTYTLYVGTAFNKVQVDYDHAASGNATFTVNNITYNEKTTIPSTDLLFDVSATDRDGDTAATSLQVDIHGLTTGAATAMLGVQHDLIV